MAIDNQRQRASLLAYPHVNIHVHKFYYFMNGLAYYYTIYYHYICNKKKQANKKQKCLIVA